MPEGRTDLTDRTIVTIDPADARDFDDAISLERIDGGHWLLGVHIADVAHFVPEKTPLDREALARGTSVYLPDRVIPMLPEIISNSLASLQPGKVRYAKTAFIEFTAEGQRVATEFHSSAIRSTKRLNYDEVDALLAKPEAWRKKLGARGPRAAAADARVGDDAASPPVHSAGRLELTMPEIKIELDAEGRVSGARVTENTESHQIIEEFMLAANEAVAERLAAEGWHFLRRIHANPTPRKLKALTEFVNGLGFKTESLESRFALQKLLDRVDRPARTTRRPFRGAAVDATGGLRAAGRRPLRPGQRLLLPLHVADPPLSRPDGASAAWTRFWPRESPATISTNWSSSATTPATANAAPRPPNANW